MANELGFSMRDLYPNYNGIDTSELASPEVDDQNALNEDVKIADKASVKEARSKNVFLAMAVIVGLIIFFGGK